jgi:crotonobetainyl-CoA:carnitine CoA-transferase CaiB-like acyl-CoA transferase
MLNTNPTILHIDNSVPCDALKGIRVVELTEYVAAPACGRMLFDYGAEVIKIERPSGDPWRLVGNNTPCGADVDENPLFDVLNAGKKSIVLNLKEWEDMEVFHKLLETADIFLTNNRMISLRRMCIDPETLAQKYPALIYGLITGYGIDGSEKDDPGFDSVAFWGRSGFMASMPYEDGGYPMPTPTGVGDVITGITLLTGILSALIIEFRALIRIALRVILQGSNLFRIIVIVRVETFACFSSPLSSRIHFRHQWPRKIITISTFTITIHQRNIGHIDPSQVH